MKPCSFGEVLWDEWDKVFRVVIQKDSSAAVPKVPKTSKTIGIQLQQGHSGGRSPKASMAGGFCTWRACTTQDESIPRDQKPATLLTPQNHHRRAHSSHLLKGTQLQAAVYLPRSP